jgi:hypothetical protein
MIIQQKQSLKNYPQNVDLEILFLKALSGSLVVKDLESFEIKSEAVAD